MCILLFPKINFLSFSASLEEARYKAKLATCTSDLSASEETKESRKYRHKKDDDTSEEEMIIKTKKRKISQEPSKNMPKLPILHSGIIINHIHG